MNISEAGVAPRDKLVDLFAEYIRLRQTGNSRQDAWRALYPLANNIGSQDLARLRTLLQNWENQAGRIFEAENDGLRTPSHSNERLEQVRRTTIEMPQVDTYQQKKHLIRRIQNDGQPPVPERASTHSAGSNGQKLCRACFGTNRSGELYCTHCGCLLEDIAAGPSKIGATRPVHHEVSKASVFSDGMVLYLKVRSASSQLTIKPLRDKEIVLGRTSADNVMVPDVDLTPFNAQSFGVSRMHASIKRHENTVVLTDMGSLNYTFVNGQRLHAHEVRVLSDGDEIRLGHLTLQVYFRHD